jgi:hypothetical protein
MVDIEAGGPGEVSHLLEEYTMEANRGVVEAVRGDARENPEAVNLLRTRGLTVDEALDLIIRNPYGTGSKQPSLSGD